MTQERYTAEQIAEILVAHRKWANGEHDGNRADLRGADLRGAYLRDAYLGDADLRDAYLRDADLRDAYLGDADLREANLGDADLRGADLRGANLGGANLREANLGGAKNIDPMAILRAQIVPEAGAFDAFKRLANGVICRLRIPAEAGRVGGLIGRKCRAEFAEVLEGEGVSTHDSAFRYVPGQIVRPDKWDPSPLIECSGGIHFFMRRIEAEEYL